MLCTLAMTRPHVSAAGIDRYPTGGNEPILTLDGERIVDAKGRVSRVTTAGAAPSLGQYLLMAYLPPEHAVEGTELRVMYMNELFPVTRRARRQPPAVRPRRHAHEDRERRHDELSSSASSGCRRPGARINVTADGQAVDTALPRLHHQPARGVRGRGGRAARRGSTAATSTVLTLGPPEAEEQLRYAASVGIGRAPCSCRSTAPTGTRSGRRAAITAAVADARGARRPVRPRPVRQRVGRSGGFQVGVRVAHALGRPMVNGAKGLDVDDGDGRGASARPTPGSSVYELPLPAVVGVKEGINLPRYPTMKGRLASKKVDVDADRAAARRRWASDASRLRRRPSRPSARR